jgi:GT2 family glycosyltransferase
MYRQPKFSIIIPVKEINDYVRETVPYIQDLELNDWELIIVPNNSDVNEWKYDDRIKFVASGRVGPADKRDLAAKIAKGEIIVFLDDDSYPKSDLLSVATKYFKDGLISAIGGPAITPESDSYWQKVSGAVYMSKFTGGNPERYIPIGGAKEVDDWPSVNFMVRRTDFLSVGGFDSPYWPGEDTHLCLKLVQSSKKIIYSPELIVWHHRRTGLYRHLKQAGAYGLHRGYFARQLPETSLRLKYFLPSLAVVMYCLVFVSLFMPALVSLPVLIGLFAYLTLVFVGCLQIAKFLGWKVAAFVLPFALATHVVYGANFIRGIARSKPLISKLR